MYNDKLSPLPTQITAGDSADAVQRGTTVHFQHDATRCKFPSHVHRFRTASNSRARRRRQRGHTNVTRRIYRYPYAGQQSLKRRAAGMCVYTIFTAAAVSWTVGVFVRFFEIDPEASALVARRIFGNDGSPRHAV